LTEKEIYMANLSYQSQGIKHINRQKWNFLNSAFLKAKNPRQITKEHKKISNTVTHPYTATETL
jgi:hypothetical protein